MASTPQPERGPGRFTKAIAAVATLGAFGILASLGAVLVGPSPPNPVDFEGLDRDDWPSCQSASVWTGQEAWTVCLLGEGERALVRFRPEEARAETVFRWGGAANRMGPVLLIARSCSWGRFFVFSEIDGSTSVVSVRNGRGSQTELDSTQHNTLGAACGDDTPNLLLRARAGYRVANISEGEPEAMETFALSSVPGRIVGAWRQDDGWNAVVDVGERAFAAGPIGGEFTPIDGRPLAVSLQGEPGGWVGFGYGERLVRVDDAFEAVHGYQGDGVVLYEGLEPSVGLVAEGGTTRYAGLAAGGLELFRDGDVLTISGRTNAPRAIMRGGPYAAFSRGSRAFPFADGRTALWGERGHRVVVLDPELERDDEIDLLERVLLRHLGPDPLTHLPWIRYAVMLGSTVAWLMYMLVTLVRRRERSELRARVLSGGYLLTMALLLSPFFDVLKHI